MADFIHKPLPDWTYNDLVAYNKGAILVAIGKGEFESAVWQATQLTLQWKKEVDEAEKAKKKKAHNE